MNIKHINNAKNVILYIVDLILTFGFWNTKRSIAMLQT